MTLVPTLRCESLLKRRRVQCEDEGSPDCCEAAPVEARELRPKLLISRHEQPCERRRRISKKTSVALVACESEKSATGYFDLLGVSRTASVDEIRRAYRRRALATHPDRGGDKDAFQKVLDAYEKLSDSSTREAYEIWCEVSGSMDGKLESTAQTRPSRDENETSRSIMEAANIVAREFLVAIRFDAAPINMDNMTPLQLLSVKKFAQGGMVNLPEDFTRCEKETARTYKGKVYICHRVQGNVRTYEVSCKILDFEVYSTKTTSLALVLDAQIALGRFRERVCTKEDLTQESLKELRSRVPCMAFHFRFTLPSSLKSNRWSPWSPSSENVALLLHYRSKFKTLLSQCPSASLDQLADCYEAAKAAIAEEKLAWAQQRKHIIGLIAECFQRRVLEMEMTHLAEQRRIAKREFDCGRRELGTETGRRLQMALGLDSVVATATAFALQRLPPEEVARRAANLVAPFTRPALRDRRGPSSRPVARSPASRRTPRTPDRKSRCLPISWPLERPSFGLAPWMDRWPKEVARWPMSCLCLEELARFQICSSATLVVGRDEFLARCRKFVYIPGSPSAGRTRSGRSVKAPQGASTGWRRTARLLSQPRFAATFESLDLSLYPIDAFDVDLYNALGRMSSLTHVTFPSNGWKCPKDRAKAIASLPDDAIVSFRGDGAASHGAHTTRHG
jgi:hypothetical protein